MRANKRLHPTPLCGPKIVAILKVGLWPTAVLIHGCGAAEAPSRWAASRTQRQSHDQPVPALWVPWGSGTSG